MKYEVKEEVNFNYIESSGDGPVILLLHGLFGALSNFEGILNEFGERYHILVPILPIYTMPLRKVSIQGLVDHVRSFVKYKKLKDMHVLGNSLGGHISLLYGLKWQENIKTLILTGSSGLFENAMGSTFPKRGNFDFIRKKTEDTFFDASIATEELVEEVYEIVNNRNKAIRVVATAKSAIRHNVGNRLAELKCPVLLIWGQQDTITPHYVGEKFHELLPNSELEFIDECGHAPMMEHPKYFNKLLKNFIEKNA